MEIKVIEGNVNSYVTALGVFMIDFGKIKENTPASVKIKIEGVKTSALSSTCGCSVVSSVEPNTFVIDYKETHITEPFAKALVLNYTETFGNKQAQITITGNVIK
jgi:hypothetical protein